MVQPEKRVLWHPRQNNKFVVGGGSQITLYEWAPDYPEIRHITSQHDLQFMKCFAWSPDPTFEDLFAIGLSTGRVDLIRMEATRHSQQRNILSSGPVVGLPVRTSRSCNSLAFCSVDPNYLAVGLDKVRGDSSLVIWDLISTTPALVIQPPSQYTSTGTTLEYTYPAPLPRPTPIIPRLDLPNASSGSGGGSGNNTNTARTDPRILQQHAPTEIVSALSFLPHSTHLLLAGISHRWLRLFDLRSASNASTISTSSSTASTAGGGGTGAGAAVQCKVNGISTDPFDAHRFATFSGEGVVSVWDARRMSFPVLTFSEQDALADGAVGVGIGSVSGSGNSANTNTSGGGGGGGGKQQSTTGGLPAYSTVEFSSTRRGTMATLLREGTYVRFWDITTTGARDFIGPSNTMSFGAGGGWGDFGSNINPSAGGGSGEGTRAGVRKSWANLPWTATASSPKEQMESGTTSSQRQQKQQKHLSRPPFILSDTRKTKHFPRLLSSFALVPNPSLSSSSSSFSRTRSQNQDQNDNPDERALPRPTHALTSNVMLVNREGDLELYAVHDTPKPTIWSSRGELAIGAGVGWKVLGGNDRHHSNRRGVVNGGHVGREETGSRSRVTRGGSGRRRSRSRQNNGEEVDEEGEEMGEEFGYGENKNAVVRGGVVSRERGRSKTGPVIPPPPQPLPASSQKGGASSKPLFGRGDEDGFPALQSTLPSTTTSSSSSSFSQTGAQASKKGGHRYQGYSPASSLKTVLAPEETVTAQTTMTLGLGLTGVREESLDKSASVVSRHPSKTGMGGKEGRRGQQRGQSVYNVIEDDISMMMRRRTLEGYGLSKPELNSDITLKEEGASGDSASSHPLSDIWAWIHHSQQILNTPSTRAYGFDFSYQGLLGIWEGLTPLPRPLPSNLSTNTPTSTNQDTLMTDSFTSISTNASSTSAAAAAAGGTLLFTDGTPTATYRDLLLDIPLLPGQTSHHDQHHQYQHQRDRSSHHFGVGLRQTASPRMGGLVGGGGGDGLGLGLGLGGGGGDGGGESGSDELDHHDDGLAYGYGDYETALKALVAGFSGANNGNVVVVPASRGPSSLASSPRLGSGGGGNAWRPSVQTNKALERQVALELCGWRLKEDELDGAIRRWEREGQHSRAACWLVFMRQSNKAVDLLMRSDDESHRMMSGTIAALLSHVSSSSASNLSQTPKTAELRQLCERLTVRLQDPYFRALLTHLALNDWTEVLEEELLPFQERLAIAFQFLDDKSLHTYLRRLAERAMASGDIEGLVLTGLASRKGMNVLQAYVDRTGDVQSAAVLSAYVCPARVADVRAERWLEAYRDLLDGWKLFHHRVGFDIERGQILNELVGVVGQQQQQQRTGRWQNGEEWVPRQVLIRCNYCNKAVNSPGALERQKGRPTTCPNCNRALPRCSVCLMTLGIVQDGVREAELIHSQHRDTIDEAIVICQTCRHGGHASHILEWFFGEGVRSQGVCPVADCQCRCADEF